MGEAGTTWEGSETKDCGAQANFWRRVLMKNKKRKRKTITRRELIMLSCINSKRLPHVVNIDGHRHQWVGIGWVNEGEPLHGDEVLVVD